jgi:hypothetical protein
MQKHLQQMAGDTLGGGGGGFSKVQAHYPDPGNPWPLHERVQDSDYAE